MALVQRDPFAREEVHREEIAPPTPGQGCSWCGGHNRRGNLYEYRAEGDANPSRPGAMPGLFCSAACWRAYHNL